VPNDAALVALLSENMLGEIPARRHAARILLDLLQRKGNLDGSAASLREQTPAVREQVEKLIERYQLR
jgi:hypothetical protein